MANCSSDVSIMHDEFFELLWDNGPVVIQGPLKSSYHADCNHVCRVQDKDRKVATYPAVESKVNILPLPAPTSGFQMSAQTDDVNPWNYPMEDSICNVNCSEYLCDYAGVDLNSTTESQMNDVKRRWPNQTIRDSNDTEQGNVSEPSRTSKSQPFLSYVANTKSRIADTGMGSTNIHDGGVGLKNFMHVSSPFALGKSQLENADKLEINEKATTATTRNLMESLLNESSINLKSSLGRQGQLALIPSKSERRSSPKSPREVIIVEPPEAFCQKDTSVMNNQCTTGNCTRSPKQIQSPSFAASVALACHETDKVQEAVVASSVYLESSSEPASNNHRQREKRKWREREESEYQSEDVEEEPVRLKKPATLQRRSTRRNRAAEVHNLSERRRRDRINEKMRVLQELIPNCNKTDKASMLDEAIEYLKTLQMQVQIMSNGGGVCMHPMMMQHIRVPTMAHFSPMGLGMGMGVGLGYGMGMYNMNGSARCPCVPIYRPRFPCSSIPGTMMLKPGQGFPMSMAHGPPVNFVPGTIPSPPIPSVSSKEQKQQTLNLEKIEKPNAGDYKMQSSIQARKECFEDIITKQT